MGQKTDHLQEIERLFTEIRKYHDGENFRQLLEFCARFNYLSPFNAWLVQLQMPGATFTLTEAQWRKKYNRKLKQYARPLIVLLPFGPIGMVFDISDTIPSETDSQNQSKRFLSDKEILEQLMAPYRTRETVSQKQIGCR